jgi:hypothetical protein
VLSDKDMPTVIPSDMSLLSDAVTFSNGVAFSVPVACLHSGRDLGSELDVGDESGVSRSEAPDIEPKVTLVRVSHTSNEVTCVPECVDV